MNTIWRIQQGHAAPIVYSMMALSLSLSIPLCVSRFSHCLSHPSSPSFPTQITTTQLLSVFFLSLCLFLHLHLYALFSPLQLHHCSPGHILSGLFDSPVMVSLILIQR